MLKGNNQHSIRTLDTTTPTLRAGMQVEEFKMKGKAAADGFAGKLAEMADKARQQTTQQQSDLRLDAIAQDFGLPPADPIAELVRDAKKLVLAKKYGAAVKILSQALKKSPGHPEALYLAAYCLAASKEYLKALKLLLPLREARLEGGLEARVEVLKAEIRRRLFNDVVLKNMAALASGKHAEAISELQQLVKLDPDVALYHFLLTGALRAADRLQEALRAAEQGLQVCPADDKAQLLALHGQIQTEYVAKLLEPARRLYKQKDYKRARAELARVSEQYRSASLYTTFDGYLGRLEGSGGVLGFLGLRKPSVETVDPPGTPRAIEELYFFLVGPELSQGQTQLKAGQCDAALTTLRAALRHAPRCAFANYLAAGCIHVRFFHSLAAGKPMDLAQAIAEMTQAAQYARVGVRDPEIQDAPALLHIIETTLQQLRQVEEESRTARQEAALVNPVIEEFLAIIKLAEGGIRSLKHFEEVKSRLKALRGRLSSVRSKVVREQSKQAINDVSEAVEANWNQLLELEPTIRENSTVEQHFMAFKVQMDLLQRGGGIKTRQQLEATRTYFRTLKSSVETDRQRLQDPERLAALDQLLDAIRNVLQQLGG